MAGRAVPAPGALLCALLCATAAAAGGGPGDNPAPGAFGHVYRGAVNISSERVYAFAYRSEPGQVGATPGGASAASPSPSRVWGVCPGATGSAAVRERAGLPLCPARILPPPRWSGAAVHLRAPFHLPSRGCRLGGCRCPRAAGWAGGLVPPTAKGGFAIQQF